jgi:hypothetical protein
MCYFLLFGIFLKKNYNGSRGAQKFAMCASFKAFSFFFSRFAFLLKRDLENWRVSEREGTNFV